MDAGFLNFHGGEHFSTLDPSYFLESHAPDEGSSYDGEHGYTWDWDNDREVELNGDIGLIPVTSDAAGDYCLMSTSPPSKEDFHKIMTEWQQLVNLETENVEELPPDVIPNDTLDTAEEPQDVIQYKHETNLFTNPPDINLCDTSTNLSISDSNNLIASSVSIPSITSIETFSHLEGKPLIHIDEDIIENNVTEEKALLADPVDIFPHLDDPIEHLANSDFDITKYVNDTDRSILPSGPGPGGKRLDLKNQRYVFDSDDDSHSDEEDRHIDVETLSEANSSSVDLEEAEGLNEIKSDLVTIDEEIMRAESVYDLNTESKTEIKFEDVVDLPYDIIEDNQNKTMGLETKIDDMIKELDMQNANLSIDDDKKVENILDIEVQKIGETMKEEVSPAIEAGDLDSLLEQFEASQTNNPKPDIGKKDHVKSKQILESLPEELINRIKQSSKRKSISVIPPIPNKKRSNIKPNINTNNIVPSLPNNNNNSNNNNNESIQMDHDYCISSSSNISSSSSTSSKKDSGFSSCEEDERSVLRNQPTVKTADGKLMVSLLKVNTIKKRKLNLEEYKQRRQGRSCSGSPARVEDENARRLKRMNTQPCPPPNMEVKTLVSIGVNTDQSWGRLQEIVRGCPSNFSSNSFITSLVEHLPQIKEVNVEGEHGEDKTIVFLDKNRTPAKTSSKYVQTVSNRRDSSSSSSSSSRSPSPVRKRNVDSEKVREVEERRVIYVGRIANSVTRECLRKRFQRFGPITNVSVHFRRTGDNYGFVTFKYKEDAYEAVEHGNEDSSLPRYDLSFGGRRIFCQTNYADLDNLRDDFCYSGLPSNNYNREDSFEELLRETQAKLLRNKRLNNKS